MTTSRDGVNERRGSQSWGIGREFTTGVPIDGFADATGEYPRRDYFFSSSINQAATGQKVNSLWIGGSTLNINFDITPQSPSTFPFSQVNETSSGHVVEVDDTPGAERILIKHRKGSGIELKPNGSIILSSRNNRVEVTEGDSIIIVSGTGEVTYEGNLNLNVVGDYNLNVGGKYNVVVGNAKTESIGSSHRVQVGKTSSLQVQGDRDVRVAGDTLNLTLGDLKHVVKGSEVNLIEGNYDLNLNGKAILTGTTLATSFRTTSIVSNNVGITAENGIIGGSNIEYHGKTYTGPSDGKGDGVTFYGSLVGRALEAFTSKYAKFSEFAFEANSSQRALFANEAIKAASEGTIGTAPNLMTKPNYKWDIDYFVNDPETLSPINSNINFYLSTSENSIKKVSVDDNLIIKSNLSALERYHGFFNRPPTLEEIRSKFRGFEMPGKFTQQQEDCINQLLSESRIGYTYSFPYMSTPHTIGRSSATDTLTNSIGYNLLGNPIENRSKKFATRLYKGRIKTIVPDPLYNPDNNKEKFTSDTKLAEGVPVSRFFGAPGSRTSISQVPMRSANSLFDRQNILRHLYLHAQIINNFETNPKFRDYKLIVTESFFDKTEIETTNRRQNINDLKLQGKAVVYKVVDSNGNVDVPKTFDVALYWKEHADYNFIFLDYDTYHPLGLLSAQIILIVPTVNKTFKATLGYNVRSTFNGFVYSPNELVEILDNR